ncbi:unnamed protein product [Prorocentrum cordatum]|uniref:NADH-cytochrome b5 reductase n=1 Tax=Prorocentrum cordatum TaxID=2364126 RepID=A0ABN9SLE0_9DINO|nr:unnamed protein product [Polarella glacialis]
MGSLASSLCGGRPGEAAGGGAVLAARVGPPVAALRKPGECVFTEEWSPAKLGARETISHDTILLTFELPDPSKPLGLSTCACMLAKCTVDSEAVIRPYTPVSTNALVGKFQLLVKVYKDGKMSQYMNSMPIGDSLDFKHIDKNVKIQYPFGRKKLTMLAGGTGITPMMQALHAILGTPGDTTEVTLIFGNKLPQDIMCLELIEDWASRKPERLKVVHILSDVGEDAGWKGARGFITKDVVKEHAAPPSEDTLVMVCGPPPMYAALCGARDDAEVTGALAELGYRKEHVFKF